VASRHEIRLTKLKCKALIGEGVIGRERVALAMPQTFMNLSGESVSQLVGCTDRPQPFDRGLR
jgi:PTH1 family peptidyl-tRNA hydrolase